MHKKQKRLRRPCPFSGTMERGVFWTDLFIRIVGCFCAMVVACIVIAVVVPGDTQQLTQLTNWVAPIVGILWMLPIIPKTRRCLRDAGHTAKSYLWLLLPVVGWVWFVVLLCKGSAETVKL